MALTPECWQVWSICVYLETALWNDSWYLALFCNKSYPGLELLKTTQSLLVHIPLNFPSKLSRASIKIFSTAFLSALVHTGGRVKPRILRPVRTRHERTYDGSKSSPPIKWSGSRSVACFAVFEYPLWRWEITSSSNSANTEYVSYLEGLQSKCLEVGIGTVIITVIYHWQHFCSVYCNRQHYLLLGTKNRHSIEHSIIHRQKLSKAILRHHKSRLYRDYI